MLDSLMLMIILVLMVVGVIFFLQARKLKGALARKEEECQRLSKEIVKVSDVANELAEKFAGVLDAKAEAEKYMHKQELWKAVRLTVQRQ